MRSPRFPSRAKRLGDVVSSEALAKTWKKKVRDTLRRQRIPDPVEHLDFHVHLNQRCATLSAAVGDGSYRPARITRILQEKSNGLCRQIVIPSPDDALLLQVLSDVLWHHAKRHQPTDRAFYEPNAQPFSKRPTSREPPYGALRSWLKFQKTVIGFTKEYQFLVCTDISNYYDNIPLIDLRSVLASMASVDESLLDLLLFVLSSMVWQPDYAMRRDIGLPQIDLDAPRVLAHCFLFELDRTLKDRGIEFARYMDDLNIGCETIKDARIILRDVDLTLQTRQLRLNSGKTRILSKENACRYFRVRQNAALDRLDERFERIRNLEERGDPRGIKARRRAERRWTKLIAYMCGSNAFNDGNGEKILKRMLTLAKRLRIAMPADILERIMIDKPSLREQILEVLAGQPLSEMTLLPIRKAVKEEVFVDDASLLLAARAVVSQICAQRRQAVVEGLEEMTHLLIKRKTPSGVLAGIMLAAKYMKTKALLTMLRETRAIWETEPTVARWVGGLRPRLAGTREWEPYKNLVERSVQKEARTLFEFHETFATKRKEWEAVERMLRAPNRSEATGITLAKWLMILSALRSPMRREKVKVELVEVHKDAWRDVFLCQEVKRVTKEKSVRGIVKPPRSAADRAES